MKIELDEDEAYIILKIIASYEVHHQIATDKHFHKEVTEIVPVLIKKYIQSGLMHIVEDIFNVIEYENE